MHKIDLELSRNLIQKIIKEKFKSQRNFCKFKDEDPGYLSKLLSGNDPKRQLSPGKILELEEKLEVAPGSVLFAKKVNSVVVPLHSPKLSAGPGKEIIFEEELDSGYEVDIDDLDSFVKLSNLLAFTVEGDSMVTTINSGDKVLVDKGQKDPIIDNKIYAIVVDEERFAKVKRLRKGVDGVIIISDNQQYSEEKILYDSEIYFEIIGRVIEVKSKV